MVDFILILFTVAMFIGGFWCGKTYQTVGAMIGAIKKKLS